MPPRKKQKTPPVPELATFPTRLKYARESAQLTKTKLSELSGVDIPRLTRFEKGVRFEGVEAATLIRLARALGQPVGWLAANEGQSAVPVFREPTDRRRKPRGK
jgi:transcriptional regulator with XRE-family HTH domain